MIYSCYTDQKKLKIEKYGKKRNKKSN